MTPRQRIALRREMARQKPDSAMLAQLQEEYQYDGIETCAGDGTCAIPCPIGINTGALIKQLRVQRTRKWGRRGAAPGEALEDGRGAVASESVGRARVLFGVWR